MISHLESQSAVHHLITQLFHRKKRSISNAIEEEKERNRKKKKKKLGDQVRYFFLFIGRMFLPQSNPIVQHEKRFINRAEVVCDKYRRIFETWGQ